MKWPNYIDCGIVNEVTGVDFLEGIKNRNKHSYLLEPEFASMFQNSDLNLDVLNKDLEKEKGEVCCIQAFFSVLYVSFFYIFRIQNLLIFITK